MKTTLIAGAALAALLSAPAFAETVPSGYVGAAWSNTEVETPLGDVDGDGFAVDGAVVWSLGGDLGLQLDAAYADVEDSDGVSATAHLFDRNDSFAFGGYVGLAEVEDETGWTAGLEAHKYLNNVTLAGGLGYATIDDSDVDVWGLNGEVRYFVSDNVRLNAGLGWVRAEAGGEDTDGLSIGAGAEYQFDAAPISLFAGVSRTEFNDFDVDATSVTVGLRYNFGGTTLKSRDRSGASFAPLGGLGSALSSF